MNTIMYGVNGALDGPSLPQFGNGPTGHLLISTAGELATSGGDDPPETYKHSCGERATLFLGVHWQHVLLRVESLQREQKYSASQLVRGDPQGQHPPCT